MVLCLYRALGIPHEKDPLQCLYVLFIMAVLNLVMCAMQLSVYATWNHLECPPDVLEPLYYFLIDHGLSVIMLPYSNLSVNLFCYTPYSSILHPPPTQAYYVRFSLEVGTL